jgi:hypothetical protein
MGIAGLIGDIFTSNANRGQVEDNFERTQALMREFWGKAEGYLQPYIGRGNEAGGMYMDALMGGPKAAEAFNAFKGSTGYETNLKAGIDGVQTTAAGRNMLNSGKTLKDSIRFGTDLNNNYFQSWLGNLATPMGLGASSAGALASGAFNFAGLGTQNSNNYANGMINANNSTNAGFQNWLGQGGQAMSYMMGGGGFGG